MWYYYSTTYRVARPRNIRVLFFFLTKNRFFVLSMYNVSIPKCWLEGPESASMWEAHVVLLALPWPLLYLLPVHGAHFWASGFFFTERQQFKLTYAKAGMHGDSLCVRSLEIRGERGLTFDLSWVNKPSPFCVLLQHFSVLTSFYDLPHDDKKKFLLEYVCFSELWLVL